MGGGGLTPRWSILPKETDGAKLLFPYTFINHMMTVGSCTKEVSSNQTFEICLTDVENSARIVLISD